MATCFTSSPGNSRSTATVVVFDNATYANAPGRPSATSMQFRRCSAHGSWADSSDVTGTSASSFSAAASTADLILLPDLLNGHGRLLRASGDGGPSYLTPGAAATPFAGSPATLANPPAPGTALNLVAFTPAGRVSIYRDQVNGFPNSTTVLLSPFGNGNYRYLHGVLNTMVQAVNAVPEPGSFLLLSGGLALCFGLRRARS